MTDPATAPTQPQAPAAPVLAPRQDDSIHIPKWAGSAIVGLAIATGGYVLNGLDAKIDHNDAAVEKKIAQIEAVASKQSDRIESNTVTNARILATLESIGKQIELLRKDIRDFSPSPE